MFHEYYPVFSLGDRLPNLLLTSPIRNSFAGLVCYQSSESGNEVPGCSGQTSGGIDYCFTPTVHTGNLPLTFIGDELSAYGECQGDCDADSEVSQFVSHRFALFLPSN